MTFQTGQTKWDGGSIYLFLCCVVVAKVEWWLWPVMVVVVVVVVVGVIVAVADGIGGCGWSYGFFWVVGYIILV